MGSWTYRAVGPEMFSKSFWNVYIVNVSFCSYNCDWSQAVHVLVLVVFEAPVRTSINTRMSIWVK